MESESIGVNLRATAHTIQGGRNHMEDEFAVAYQAAPEGKDLLYAFFGVFDGHGGNQASLFVKNHLMDSIVSSSKFWRGDDSGVLEAIRQGFLSTHHNMMKEHNTWPLTSNGYPSTAGTTATIVFIKKGKMYIGHVGDSGIVVGLENTENPGEKWIGKKLTNDHKPRSTSERERIEKAGGKVAKKNGIYRVVWNRSSIRHSGPVRRSTLIDEIPFLSVARALGDFWSYNYGTREFIVSPEPEVSIEVLDLKKHRCIILASDGLWNVANGTDAVGVAWACEKNNESLFRSSFGSPGSREWQNPSQRIVDSALHRWLSSNLRPDNITVLTILIDPPGPPRPQPQMVRENVASYFIQREIVQMSFFYNQTCVKGSGGKAVGPKPSLLQPPSKDKKEEGSENIASLLHSASSLTTLKKSPQLDREEEEENKVVPPTPTPFIRFVSQKVRNMKSRSEEGGGGSKSIANILHGALRSGSAFVPFMRNSTGGSGVAQSISSAAFLPSEVRGGEGENEPPIEEKSRRMEEEKSGLDLKSVPMSLRSAKDKGVIEKMSLRSKDQNQKKRRKLRDVSEECDLSSSRVKLETKKDEEEMKPQRVLRSAKPHASLHSTHQKKKRRGEKVSKVVERSSYDLRKTGIATTKHKNTKKSLKKLLISSSIKRRGGGDSFCPLRTLRSSDTLIR